MELVLRWRRDSVRAAESLLASRALSLLAAPRLQALAQRFDELTGGQPVRAAALALERAERGAAEATLAQAKANKDIPKTR